MKQKTFKILAVCLALALWMLPTMVMAAPQKSDKMSKAPAKETVSRATPSKVNTDKTNIDKTNTSKADTSKKAVPAAKKEEPMLRVGLAEEQNSAVFSADNDYVVRDGATGKGLEKKTHKDKLTITVKNHQFVLNGKAVSAKKIKLKPVDSKEKIVFSYNDTKYRGEFELVLKNGSFTVINIVKLDDYIGGVLNEEMGEGWPSEAMKAQAVAARTFALYTVGEEKHEEDGYDVCATTHCQVYGGVESESRDALAAVSATRGEVMTYGGKPIYAAFHASSGGRTAGSDETNEVLPYLKSRLDREDSVNPNQEWQVAVPVTTLVQKLRSEGYNIGTLKRIEISPLDIQSPKPSKDRYTSCRVKTVRFVGSVKTVEVPGTKLRWVFGLHSTLFDIRYGSGKSIKPNKDGKIEIKNRSGETITFDGAGWGHGLGLSQWGARGMAAKHGYRDILARYYTDVKIEKLF